VTEVRRTRLATAPKRALKYLLYGGGEFVERLHDFLDTEHYKVKSFGLSSALELYGTIKPNDYPPLTAALPKPCVIWASMCGPV
jgi:hypothetical protein